MDTRHLIAWLLIAVMIAAIGGAWAYATRERRARRRGRGRR
jgi:hypothetical protein